MGWSEGAMNFCNHYFHGNIKTEEKWKSPLKAKAFILAIDIQGSGGGDCDLKKPPLPFKLILASSIDALNQSLNKKTQILVASHPPLKHGDM